MVNQVHRNINKVELLDHINKLTKGYSKFTVEFEKDTIIIKCTNKTELKCPNGHSHNYCTVCDGALVDMENMHKCSVCNKDFKDERE